MHGKNTITTVSNSFSIRFISIWLFLMFIATTSLDHIELIIGFSVSDIFLILLLFVLIGQSSISGHIRLPNFLLGFSILLSLATVSSSFSPIPLGSIRRVVSLAGMFLSFWITYSLLRRDRRLLRLISEAFIFSGCLLSLTVWIQYIAFNQTHLLWEPKIYGYQQLSGTFLEGTKFFRATGIYFDPNFLAFYLLPSLIFSFYKTLSFELHKIRHFLIFVFILSAFIMTFSRGQFLSLFVIICVTVLLGRRTPKKQLILSLASIMIITAAIFFLVSVVSFIKNFNPGAVLMRLSAWKWGFVEVMRNPLLGVGLGLPVYNLDFGIRMEEHNTFLQILRGVGIFGFFIFIYLISKTLIFTLKDISQNKDRNTLPFYYAYLGLFIGAFSINALFLKHFWIILAVLYTLKVARNEYSMKGI